MTDSHDNTDHATTDEPASRGIRIPAVAWLGMLCFLISAAAVVLMFWVPRIEHRRAVDEVERLGGTVVTDPAPAFWWGRVWGELTGEPEGRVVVVDLSAAHLTDESVAVVRAFPSVEMVSLGGPDLTDVGLLRLIDLNSLRRVVLVNCPRISEAAEQALLREIPGLEISRRGPALLGVMGQRHVRGCWIRNVRPGTAAAKGGLKPGDIVTRIANRRIGGFEDLVREVSRHQPGDRILVTVFRNGHERKLPVTLGHWQDSH